MSKAQEPDLQYLTTIGREMGLHPKSLHQLRKMRLERGAEWPVADSFLPDGRELYDVASFHAWYTKNVSPHWSAKGRTA